MIVLFVTIIFYSSSSSTIDYYDDRTYDCCSCSILLVPLFGICY